MSRNSSGCNLLVAGWRRVRRSAGPASRRHTTPSGSSPTYGAREDHELDLLTEKSYKPGLRQTQGSPDNPPETAAPAASGNSGSGLTCSGTCAAAKPSSSRPSLGNPPAPTSCPSNSPTPRRQGSIPRARNTVARSPFTPRNASPSSGQNQVTRSPIRPPPRLSYKSRTMGLRQRGCNGARAMSSSYSSGGES
jgi:hypothetical protein